MKKQILTLFTMATMAGAFAQPCSDLFISEYFESNVGNNKMLEVYNPTNGAINLANYQLKIFVNGGTTPSGFNIFQFPPINLPSGATYTLVNSGASFPILLGAADTLVSGVGNICNFNGDDAIGLFNGSNMIDVIGLIGNDPGTEWLYGTFSTKDKDLVRKASIQQGVLSWDSVVAVNNWDVYAVNDTSHLGAHTMTPCAVITDTVVAFNPYSGTYNEGQSFNLTATLINPSPVTSFQVSAVLKSGDPADVNNYTTQTLTFNVNGTTASTSITITDDAIPEGAETLTFALRNPTGGVVLGNDSIYTLNINPSDQPLNFTIYPIGTVRGNDANGSPDSINVVCTVAGVVYGVNTRSTGLQFFINDHTGGIGVFSNANTFGYTVTEGDSIVVMGEVDSYRGLGQMSFLDTIVFVSSGNTLQTPTVVTALNEGTEGELIRINGVHLVSPSQWTGASAGFNVDITNGSQTFQMRVAPNTTVVGMSAPTGNFDVIGTGSQFATTSTSPFADGYQIQPRYIADIILLNGVEEEEQVNVSMFPNPSKGQLNVTLGTDMNNVTIEVVDMTGKVVQVRNLNNLFAGQTTTLNLENHTNGVYMVRVKGNQFQVTRKVVLNK